MQIVLVILKKKKRNIYPSAITVWGFSQ